MATIRQKKAFDKTLEYSGNVSKAMREAGYSPTVSKTPKTLTESKGWKELLNEYLSDDLLAERHRELLNKREYSKNEDGVVIEQPDTQAVSKALDMAYKLRGDYAPDKHVNLNFNSNDEHKEKAIRAIRNITRRGDTN